MGSPLPIKVLQDREIAAAEAAGDEFFLGLPDAWYEPRPTYGCNNGHVSSRYLKSEERGPLCIDCQEGIAMLPHRYDTDEKLKVALDEIRAQQQEAAGHEQ